MITPLRPADVSWAADVMARRRRRYAGYSPVFWRPAADARDRHEPYLWRLVSGPDTVALRTEHAFLIGVLRPGECVVDDFAVDDAGEWSTDGRALLVEAWQRVGGAAVRALRVVTAKADEPKVAMLVDAGLALAQEWWVKPVEPLRAAPRPGRFGGTGFAGILGPAPPVYDPGGPVLLVDRLDPATTAESVARQAAEAGAVLTVIATDPGWAPDGDGWSVASQWYVGRPS